MKRSQGSYALVFVFCAVFLLNSITPGQAFDFPSLDMSSEEFTILEQAFFKDLSDGVLHDFDYYDAFLIASGICQEVELSKYQKQLMKIRSRTLDGLDKGVDPYLLGKSLLFRLHDQVLKEYVETASLAGTLLDEGKYNCLSSTILYCLTARELGLAVSGVLVPGHTFCVLSDPRGDKMVETTVRYGFDPGKIEVERLKQLTRYVYVPETIYTEKKIVDWRELLSLLYTNNLNLEDFVVHDDYADYLPRFKKGLLFDPSSGVLKKNIFVCLNNLAVLSLETEELEQAYFFIQQGKRLGLSAGDFEEVEIQYYNQAAAERADIPDYRGAVQLLRAGLRIYPKDSVLTNNALYFYGLWAESYARRADHAAAVDVFLEALASFPENEEIRKNLRIAFYNYAAQSYNSREYDNVAAICREALSFFPEDDSFTGMITDARKMMGQ